MWERPPLSAQEEPEATRDQAPAVDSSDMDPIADLASALNEFQSPTVEPETGASSQGVAEMPPSLERDESTADVLGTIGEPSPTQDQPDLETATDLESALSEFLSSMDPVGSAGPEDSVAEPTAGEEAVETTPHVPASQEQPATVQEPTDFAPAGDLQSALNEFLSSMGQEDVAPAVEEPASPEPPPGPQIEDSAPAVPTGQEPSPESQPGDDFGSPDDLQSALSEFLGSKGEQGGAPPAPQMEESAPAIPTGQEPPPESQPADELGSSDDLQSALSEFLGSMGQQGGAPPADEPPPGPPIEESTDEFGSPDDLQSALSEFLSSMGEQGGAPSGDESSPGPQIEESTPAGPTFQEPSPESQPADEIGSADDLQSALSEFLSSMGEQGGAPSGDESSPGPQIEESTPAGPTFQEPSPESQPADEIGSADDLQSALNEFLGSMGEQGGEPPGDETTEPSSGPEIVDSAPAAPAFQEPKSESPQAGELQSALNEFLGSMGEQDAALPGNQPEGSAMNPQVVGSAPAAPTVPMPQPETQPASEFGSPDQLQSGLNVFLGSMGQPGETLGSSGDVQDSPQAPAGGLHLDNLVFMGGGGGEAPASADQDVRDAPNVDASQALMGSMGPASGGLGGGVGDDLGVRLKQAHPGITLAEGVTGLLCGMLRKTARSVE